jgi:hypothetical protein
MKNINTAVQLPDVFLEITFKNAEIKLDQHHCDVIPQKPDTVPS